MVVVPVGSDGVWPLLLHLAVPLHHAHDAGEADVLFLLPEYLLRCHYSPSSVVCRRVPHSLLCVVFDPHRFRVRAYPIRVGQARAGRFAHDRGTLHLAQCCWMGEWSDWRCFGYLPSGHALESSVKAQAALEEEDGRGAHVSDGRNCHRRVISASHVHRSVCKYRKPGLGSVAHCMVVYDRSVHWVGLH